MSLRPDHTNRDVTVVFSVSFWPVTERQLRIHVSWHVTLCLWVSVSRRLEGMRGNTEPESERHIPEDVNPLTN